MCVWYKVYDHCSNRLKCALYISIFFCSGISLMRNLYIQIHLNLKQIYRNTSIERRPNEKLYAINRFHCKLFIDRIHSIILCPIAFYKQSPIYTYIYIFWREISFFVRFVLIFRTKFHENWKCLKNKWFLVASDSGY